MTFTNQINNAEFILRTLEAEGVEYFFMVPGKLINPLMSQYNKQTSSQYKIRPVIAAHEAGATAMADGYSRAKEHLGVCMVIDGPGTANAIPMLTAAQADKSSVLLIAGQIPRDFQGVGAIQDSTASGISTVDMLKPVCNKSTEILHSNLLPRFLRSSIRNIVGTKGTGYLSIAKDIFLEKTTEMPNAAVKPYDTPSLIDKEACEKFIQEILSNNKKIMILVGSHCNKKQLYPILKDFSEKYAIPVATTISSKGLFDEEHQNFAGLYGYSGHTRASETILNHESDVLILLGFDVTQWTTLAWHPQFLAHKNLVQVDTSSSQIGEYIDVSRGIISDPRIFLQYLDENAEKVLKNEIQSRESWIAQIRQKSLYSQELADIKEGAPIHPSLIVQEARNVFPKNTVAVADAGVHRSYATHYWKTYGSNQFFAATKYAPMGWAVPASIGIKLALPQQPVITFTGDGCMLMSGLEIQTAVKLNLDITFVVFNNGYYGASYFNNIENEEYLTKIPLHNWAMIGEGLGAKGFRVTEQSALKEIYQEALQYRGPKVIDIICDHTARAPFRLYAETLKTHPFM